MQTVITLTELAERWGKAPNSIRDMEAEGTLHRLPKMPGRSYSMAEVVQLESIGDAAKGMTAWERRQKDEEIAGLREEVTQLRQRLASIMAVAQGGAL